MGGLLPHWAATDVARGRPGTVGSACWRCIRPQDSACRLRLGAIESTTGAIIGADLPWLISRGVKRCGSTIVHEHAALPNPASGFGIAVTLMKLLVMFQGCQFHLKEHM